MFPLDPNLVIGILIATVIVAYVTILKKLRPSSYPADMKTKKDTSLQEGLVKKKKEPSKDTKTSKPKKPSSACLHEFGYLGTLPKNASIPDECLGCPEIVKCLTRT
ncbi:hypothetical protein GTO27_01175 [Candidatus Bathyarchaeota archaeon]|nr:hypothetical protein [Candidatus Bathyarchaeota archaeon]